VHPSAARAHGARLALAVWPRGHCATAAHAVVCVTIIIFHDGKAAAKGRGVKEFTQSPLHQLQHVHAVRGAEVPDVGSAGVVAIGHFRGGGVDGEEAGGVWDAGPTEGSEYDKENAQSNTYGLFLSRQGNNDLFGGLLFFALLFLSGLSSMWRSKGKRRKVSAAMSMNRMASTKVAHHGENDAQDGPLLGIHADVAQNVAVTQKGVHSHQHRHEN
jgi:hypothetical protein